MGRDVVETSGHPLPFQPLGAASPESKEPGRDARPIRAQQRTAWPGGGRSERASERAEHVASPAGRTDPERRGGLGQEEALRCFAMLCWSQCWRAWDS